MKDAICLLFIYRVASRSFSLQKLMPKWFAEVDAVLESMLAKEFRKCFFKKLLMTFKIVDFSSEIFSKDS